MHFQGNVTKWHLHDIGKTWLYLNILSKQYNGSLSFVTSMGVNYIATFIVVCIAIHLEALCRESCISFFSCSMQVWASSLSSQKRKTDTTTPFLLLSNLRSWKTHKTWQSLQFPGDKIRLRTVTGNTKGGLPCWAAQQGSFALFMRRVHSSWL